MSVASHVQKSSENENEEREPKQKTKQKYTVVWSGFSQKWKNNTELIYSIFELYIYIYLLAQTNAEETM